MWAVEGSARERRSILPLLSPPFHLHPSPFTFSPSPFQLVPFCLVVTLHWIGLDLLLDWIGFAYICMYGFWWVVFGWENGKRPRVYVRGKSHGHNAGVLALAFFSVFLIFLGIIICWNRTPADKSKLERKKLCKPNPKKPVYWTALQPLN